MESEIKLKIQKFREYLDYFERHYDNVQKAWDLVKSKCGNKGFRFMSDDFVYGTIEADVINHDESKLSSAEFTQYRQYFFPTKNEKKDKSLFNSAWEHHKQNNVHHWQGWTNQITTPYDDAFVVMMVVDWVAMSFEFEDTAKEYYEKNKKSILIPEWAVELIYRIFECVYPDL